MTAKDDNAALFDAAIRKFGSGPSDRPLVVLDLGCGDGAVVRLLEERGYEAFGCDVYDDFSLMRDTRSTHQLREITFSPYRLPFDDGQIDAVVSTQVMEHVQNKEETLVEIRRVLKPGGVTAHVFPSKWHLPFEPHIHTPLASWLWPKVPSAWITLWAMMGLRNRWQSGQSWKQVRDDNVRFCQAAVDYRSLDFYKEAMTRVFGHFESPMDFYVYNSGGRYSRVLSKLPAAGVLATVSGVFRQRFIVSRHLG